MTELPVVDIDEIRRVMEEYAERGWTDGLPVMPVTELAAWSALELEGYVGRAIWQSTTGTAPMLLVNGPIRERIGLNGKGNVFGSGLRDERVQVERGVRGHRRRALVVALALVLAEWVPVLLGHVAREETTAMREKLPKRCPRAP